MADTDDGLLIECDAFWCFRVHPETTVYELRQELDTQIHCNLLPAEFVFLRCVGRCFTVVCHF